jgi:uncharacterized membrane protein YhhN
MKKAFVTFGVCIVLALVFIAPGCGAMSKAVARQAVDLAVAACVAEHEWMEENELAKVCLLAEDAMPAVRELLSAHKRGAMKMAASRDSGSD